MSQCSCPKSQYIYSACAYGVAGELERPSRQSINTLAPSVLGADGGRSSNQVQNFKFDRFVSVADAQTEVGGSYDQCHDIHTTYAFSQLEGLNVGGMLTADRVISHLHIYAPGDPASTAEPSFTITGSQFENLRIAGYEVDIQLATSEFHDLDTHSKAEKGDEWLLANQLGKAGEEELQKLETTYHALKGIIGLVKGCKQESKKPTSDKESGEKASHCRTYLFSPVKVLKLKGYTGTDIKILGNIICIPKFGVIRLADLLVNGHFRSFTMFRVQMCSGADGGASGGGTSGSGGTPFGN
jgi:hypothetical protein